MYPLERSTLLPIVMLAIYYSYDLLILPRIPYYLYPKSLFQCLATRVRYLIGHLQ